jgi:L-lactate dehydrogenase complex protein LldG
MSAREEILGRVRSALADVTDPDVTETPVDWTYGATVDTGDLGLVDRFAERVADYRATVEQVPHSASSSASTCPGSTTPTCPGIGVCQVSMVSARSWISGTLVAAQNA